MKRGKKIQVKLVFSNRWLYTFILLGILGIVAVGVYAYGTSTPSTFGHSAGEIDFNKILFNSNGNHAGAGNILGYAAIENDGSTYNALMILGRTTSTNPLKRVVKLWDYLQINGNLDVTGTITSPTLTGGHYGYGIQMSSHCYETIEPIYEGGSVLSTTRCRCREGYTIKCISNDIYCFCIKN
jgi:hypothetical protein